MIGPKKLSTIRAELREALSGEGDDPIRSLEKRLATLKRRSGAGRRTEILESLRRVLEGDAPSKGQRKRKRAGART